MPSQHCLDMTYWLQGASKQATAKWSNVSMAWWASCAAVLGSCTISYSDIFIPNELAGIVRSWHGNSTSSHGSWKSKVGF